MKTKQKMNVFIVVGIVTMIFNLFGVVFSTGDNRGFYFLFFALCFMMTGLIYVFKKVIKDEL